ncbi:DUF3618 domain-containing protein [Streptomyces sp. NPDC050504]|uniref:DUF3618 domain-containing protein n=1 Tax=Streptomyces sp. NPDC050504 TaxID=3365618 RepID=UPI0037ACC126
MTHSPADRAAVTPDDLRGQVEQTRRELGRTVAALAAKADVKARTRKKAVAVKDQAGAKAVQLASRVGEESARLGRLTHDKASGPVHQVRVRTEHARRFFTGESMATVRGQTGQAIRTVRSHRAVLLCSTTVLGALFLVRRSRRRPR